VCLFCPQGAARPSNEEAIKIKERSFAEKLKEFELMDAKAFLASDAFRQSAFTYDADRGLILHAR
jgi:hypothetical protein